MKGKKRPDVSARARLRGPLHWNYGKKRPRPKTGPKKLRAYIGEIKERIASGETMTALAAEFAVDYKTIETIRNFVVPEPAIEPRGAA